MGASLISGYNKLWQHRLLSSEIFGKCSSVLWINFGESSEIFEKCFISPRGHVNLQPIIQYFGLMKKIEKILRGSRVRNVILKELHHGLRIIKNLAA